MILNSCCLAEKLQNVKKNVFLFFAGGGGGREDKPAWTVCPPGVKISRVEGKISRDILPPGGQAIQGGKRNCYSTTLKNANSCTLVTLT